MNFLADKELLDKIYDTIYYSEKQLLILSPFIQLDDYFKEEVFKTLLGNAHVHIIIGFGKNEQNVTKSFKKQDIEYFMQFPNITIVYIPKLHGKYYGNEKNAVVTSMNLINYSFLNNIEFGAYATKKLIGNNDFFEKSQAKCFEVLENGHTVFVKRPKYKKKVISFSGKGDYVGSEIELDLIKNIVNGEDIPKIAFSEFVDEKYVNAELKEIRREREPIKTVLEPNKKIEQKSEYGFCIRTGKKIRFNPKQPMSKDSWRIWNEYKNKDFPEKYCHQTGKLSKGKTTMNKPIM